MKDESKKHHESANQNHERPSEVRKGMARLDWEPKWEILVSIYADLADMEDDRCRKYVATR